MDNIEQEEEYDDYFESDDFGFDSDYSDNGLPIMDLRMF